MQTALLAFLFAATAADAQAPPSPANSQTLPLPQGTVRCAPMPPQASEQGERASSGTVGQAPGGLSAGSLSDRLALSGGVLCPPSHIDPQMHKDAPDAGKTPIIPPPGDPGGDPSIRPK
jgi:hypothetical protein